jgi:hypothetical protein
VPAKSASGVPEPRRSETDPAFTPTIKQIAYLFALRDALVPTGDKQHHDSALAKRVKVSRQTIYEWKQDPGFRAWLHDQLGTEQAHHKWLLMLETHYELGIRGSVKSAEFIARARSIGIKGGGFQDSVEHVDQSITNYSVTIMAPRPPALPEKTVGGGPA